MRADDDSTLLPTTPPTSPLGGVSLPAAAARALGANTSRVDAPDGLADLSDNFGTASQVRIAIATVNSNGVVGSLGTAVVVKDNSGPQTNSTQGSVPDLITGLAASPTSALVCPNNVAGATTATPGSSTAGCGGLANAPGAWTGQGQVLQDRFGSE